ncbi:MAG: hypothetical protein K2Q06_11730, partial [Parvularculaceae bacterium]|nr:hypothetical protein [Parvularculaceae bacterium]
AALAAARPLDEVLWRREIENRPLDTPERKAALRSHLRALVKSIADPDVRRAYGQSFAERLDGAFPAAAAARPARGQGGGASYRPGRGRFPPPPGAALAAARPSTALKAHGAPTAFAREAILILAILRHPDLLERRESEVLALHLETAALRPLLDKAISAIFASPGLDSEKLRGHLQQTEAADTLERILKDETLNAQSFLRPTAEPDEVDRGWSDALRIHHHACLAEADVAETAAAAFSAGEEGWKAAVKLREEAKHVAEQAGASEDGDSKSEFMGSLERLRASIERKSRRGR